MKEQLFRLIPHFIPLPVGVSPGMPGLPSKGLADASVRRQTEASHMKTKQLWLALLRWAGRGVPDAAAPSALSAVAGTLQLHSNDRYSLSIPARVVLASVTSAPSQCLS